MRLIPVRILLAALLLLGACTSATEVAPSPTAAPPASPGTYATARAAFDVLLERHVDRPSSKTVLDAASHEVKAFVDEHGGAGKVQEPQYSGDANADFARFSFFMDQSSARVTGSTPVDLERVAVNGMVRGLNECHTYYLDPERAKNFNAPGGEQYSGIGAVISQPNPNTDKLPEISAVFPGSPAERAGVKMGDRIAAVNDRSVAGLTAQEVANMIRGPEGTQVTIKVTRPSGDRTFTITRTALRAPTVIDQGIHEGFGWVRIPTVVSNAPRELAEILAKLEQAGAKGWILDLRSNPGGDLTAAQLIASTFIRNGVLAYETGRDGQTRPLPVQQKAFYPHPKPIAVLVNKGTASGSEIIASAVQEQKAGRVFGAQTAGCVGVAQPRELPDGGLLLVTIARIQSGVSRRDLNGEGVAPDEQIDVTPDDSTDKILDAAVAWLRTQTQ